MTKLTNFDLSLEVRFHERCKCNRHKTKKTRVYINVKITDADGNCVKENDWIVMCRLQNDGNITWEYDVPEFIIDEVIKMYSDEEIINIFENLPVKKKF